MPAAGLTRWVSSPKWKCGREHVLGDVDGEVAQQDVERRARPSPASTSGSTPSRVTASMNPAPNARQASMNRSPRRDGAPRRARRPRCPARPPAAKPSGFTGMLPGEREQRLAGVEGGIVEHPVEQRGEQLADPRARGHPVPGDRLPVIARSPRVSGSPRRADLRRRSTPTVPRPP